MQQRRKAIVAVVVLQSLNHNQQIAPWMASWLVLSAIVGYVMADCSSYMSNEELADYLATTATLEPTLSSIYSIGFTEQGLDIPVLELSAAEATEQVPNVKFVAGVHGDEAIGTQVLISFIEYLMDAYRREERFVTWLLNNTRIHILPRLNLEGYQMAVEGVCNLGPGRDNSAGYDLNRAFSPSGDYVSEAAAVISWLKSDVYVLSATLNAGEMVAVYPPDNPEDFGGMNATTDDDVFKHLASVYARNHRSMSEGSGCKDTIFNNGTTSGAAWYPIKGSMQDFNYKSGTMELTLEIGCCKFPPSDQICSIWNENKLALLKLAAEACRGVRGRVTASGKPIPGATVSVLGRNMTVRTNEQGYYFRILLPGRYFIKVEAVGMKTFIKEFFVPKSDTAFLKWEVVNVQLEFDSSIYPASQDSIPEEHTMTYDEGGLDPYTTYSTPTYDDSYLSSPGDSDPKVGHITGSANETNQNNLYLIYLVIFCKYFLVSILTDLIHNDVILL